MSESTNISWTHHTRNFWTGCTKVSPACAHCYAETMAKRNTKTFGQWGRGAPRAWHGESARADLIRWNRHAAAAGERRLVFINSMSDWLDDEVPIEWLAQLLDAIRITPHLTHLLLTKRPQNWLPRLEAVLDYTDFAPLESMALEWTRARQAPTNVWIGTTVEDQARAYERLPHLLNIPAATRFLSCEPLLEPLDLTGIKLDPSNPLFLYWPLTGHHITDGMNEPRRNEDAQHIHWVIVGGESGDKHRPFNAAWARDLRDQCAAAGVPFHMKQMSGTRPSTMPPIPPDLQIRQWPA